MRECGPHERQLIFDKIRVNHRAGNIDMNTMEAYIRIYTGFNGNRVIFRIHMQRCHEAMRVATSA
jgi:hypothetical protein